MSVLSERNYKRFLKGYIDTLPGHGRGEMSRMARHLKVSSTFLSQVLSSDKHLSFEQAKGITEYLGLSALETDYFLQLVHVERAGTTSLKNYYEEKLEQLRGQGLRVANRIETARELTDTERATFYSSPLYAAIWLYTSVSEKGQTLETLIERFDLPRTRAVEIVRFLVDAGLCIEKNSSYTMGPQSTHVGQGSPHLLNHYRNWHLQALAQSETLTSEELMYSVAISLSREDFALLREQMVRFIKDLLKTAHASPAEEIACFNMDFFWIGK
jgi:uncharacterized protein (TIGR02147 family)